MTGPKTNEREGTRAFLRSAPMSAYKVREVLDLIRGEEVGRAAEILEFCERGAAEVVGKVLASRGRQRRQQRRARSRGAVRVGLLRRRGQDPCAGCGHGPAAGRRGSASAAPHHGHRQPAARGPPGAPAGQAGRRAGGPPDAVARPGCRDAGPAPRRRRRAAAEGPALAAAHDHDHDHDHEHDETSRTTIEVEDVIEAEVVDEPSDEAEAVDEATRPRRSTRPRRASRRREARPRGARSRWARRSTPTGSGSGSPRTGSRAGSTTATTRRWSSRTGRSATT